jgi:D-lactate dehydrogenase
VLPGVPGYSPNAAAEHAVALMLALNRKLVISHNRVSELNFSLEGLTGFDMQGKVAGIVGTGKIGAVVARILSEFGCSLLAYDVVENAELKDKFSIVYTDFNTLCSKSDIITLPLHLTPASHYIVNRDTRGLTKKGVILINTSLGVLIHTKDVIEAIKSERVGYFGMDVYEEEEQLFLKTIRMKMFCRMIH